MEHSDNIGSVVQVTAALGGRPPNPRLQDGPVTRFAHAAELDKHRAIAGNVTDASLCSRRADSLVLQKNGAGKASVYRLWHHSDVKPTQQW